MICRPTPRRAVLAVLVAAASITAACSSSDDDDETAAEVSTSTDCGTESALTDDYEGGELSAGYDAEGVTGSEDPDVQDELPEEIVTTPFPTVGADHVIAKEAYGVGQGAFHLVDVEEGSLGYLNIASGADVWAPVGGTEDGLLAAVGAEGFRPRGARGQLVAVVTFFDQNGNVTGEICLPRNQYPQVGGRIPQLTPDAAHMLLHDRRLPGYLLVDVAEQEIVDELELDPACLPGVHLADADTGYVVCWRTGEIHELSIGDGTLEVADSAEAFEPETPVLDGGVVFAPESGLLTITTRFSEVLPVDLSDGLPSEPVEPVRIAERGHIVRANEVYVTPDGTRAVVGYVAGDDYTSGDPALWRVLDTEDWTEVRQIEMPHGAPSAVLPTADSTGIHVLTNEVTPAGGGADEDEPTTVLSVVDLASGEEVQSTRLELTTDGDEFTGLYRPVALGGA